MPKASGTSATVNIGTECDAAAKTSPAAPHTSPNRKTGLSPSRATIGRMKPPWMIAPRRPKPARKYPVRPASKPKRRAAKSANVVWNMAKANQ